MRVSMILYYKALTSMDAEIKNDSLKNALTTDAVKENRAFIMNTPAFRRLCRMDDGDLRSLASGKNADKLMDRYISEMAKEKQQETNRNPGQKDRQPGGPEENGPEI